MRKMFSLRTWLAHKFFEFCPCLSLIMLHYYYYYYFDAEDGCLHSIHIKKKIPSAFCEISSFCSFSLLQAMQKQSHMNYIKNINNLNCSISIGRHELQVYNCLIFSIVKFEHIIKWMPVERQQQTIGKGDGTMNPPVHADFPLAMERREKEKRTIIIEACTSKTAESKL